MIYSDIVKKVAKELGLSVLIVDKTYKAYWYFIKQSILLLPLKDIETELEFNLLSTNFNVPSLGKLTCTYDRMLRIKDRHITLKEKNYAKYNRS